MNINKSLPTLTSSDTQALESLRGALSTYDSLAIAISGGVDSTTLAAVAHEVLGERVLMVHAVSPAVPQEATERVKYYAQTLGWNLTIVDAGEFADGEYRKNPVNRCYYCKSNLYARVSQVWDGTVASGANLDDLGDYRPGLLAASEKKVVHPLIDAGINKMTVRAIAASMALALVADLPAQPCLSSRIETGIAIDAVDLQFVNQMESFLSGQMGMGDIRCRITASGVRIEVDDELQQGCADIWESVCEEVRLRVEGSGRVLAGFSSYQRGSAFLISDISVVVSRE